MPYFRRTKGLMDQYFPGPKEARARLAGRQRPWSGSKDGMDGEGQLTGGLKMSRSTPPASWMAS